MDGPGSSGRSRDTGGNEVEDLSLENGSTTNSFCSINRILIIAYILLYLSYESQSSELVDTSYSGAFGKNGITLDTNKQILGSSFTWLTSHSLAKIDDIKMAYIDITLEPQGQEPVHFTMTGVDQFTENRLILRGHIPPSKIPWLPSTEQPEQPCESLAVVTRPPSLAIPMKSSSFKLHSTDPNTHIWHIHISSPECRLLVNISKPTINIKDIWSKLVVMINVLFIVTSVQSIAVAIYVGGYSTNTQVSFGTICCLLLTQVFSITHQALLRGKLKLFLPLSTMSLINSSVSLISLMIFLRVQIKRYPTALSKFVVAAMYCLPLLGVLLAFTNWKYPSTFAPSIAMMMLSLWAPQSLKNKAARTFFVPNKWITRILSFTHLLPMVYVLVYPFSVMRNEELLGMQGALMDPAKGFTVSYTYGLFWSAVGIFFHFYFLKKLAYKYNYVQRLPAKFLNRVRRALPLQPGDIEVGEPVEKRGLIEEIHTTTQGSKWLDRLRGMYYQFFSRRVTFNDSHLQLSQTDHNHGGGIVVPVVGHATEMMAGGNEEQDECIECVICMLEIEIMDKVNGTPNDDNVVEHFAVTPCEHLFHYSCLLRWYKVKPECPACRNALPSFEKEPSTIF